MLGARAKVLAPASLPTTEADSRIVESAMPLGSHGNHRRPALLTDYCEGAGGDRDNDKCDQVHFYVPVLKSANIAIAT